MTTIADLLALRPPTGVRVDLLCRVLVAFQQLQKKKARPASLDPARIAIVDGDVVLEVGIGADDSVAIAQLFTALVGAGPGTLVSEHCPGAPWLLEHLVARARASTLPPFDVIIEALGPWRADSLDETTWSAQRRVEAEALVAQAQKLSSVGPNPSVVAALDEACRVDPSLRDAHDRRNRVAVAGGVDVTGLRREMHGLMHEVLRTKDERAATRLAELLHGPHSDPRRVLDPLGDVDKPQKKQKQTAAAAPAAAIAAALVLMAAGASFFLFAKSAPEPVPSPIVAITEPVPVPPLPPPPPSELPPVTQPRGQASIMNIWLEGCGDCMPTFEAWKRAVDAQQVPSEAIVVNVAYGSERESTRAFASRYHVEKNLMFDVDGAMFVRPMGIGTFTTFVIDADGQEVWRGRAVDEGFSSALNAAWQKAKK